MVKHAAVLSAVVPVLRLRDGVRIAREHYPVLGRRCTDDTVYDRCPDEGYTDSARSFSGRSMSSRVAREVPLRIVARVEEWGGRGRRA